MRLASPAGSRDIGVFAGLCGFARNGCTDLTECFSQSRKDAKRLLSYLNWPKRFKS
jgi:hypothetical protein